MFPLEVTKKINFKFEALNLIPSKAIREYLVSNEYVQERIKNVDSYLWKSFPIWSYMQLATVFLKYAPKRKAVRFLRQMADFDRNTDEKALFRMAARDLSKHKYRGVLSPKTLAFYDSHFKSGPAYPFEELLYLPIDLQKGDVIKYTKKNKSIYGIVYAIPDYEKDKFWDFSDESVTIFYLDGKEEILDEEKQFYHHTHIHPAELDKVTDTQIPKQYKQTVKQFRGIYCQEIRDSREGEWYLPCR